MTIPEVTGARERATTDISHDLAVIAGAGAGKTTVLVRRFLTLARDPAVGPDRVLAITFTRKAAVEMKERAVRILESTGETELRRRTEAAYISTIHGFAERVLRERPMAARIDPAFSVLTDYDQALFVEDALRAMYSRDDLCSFARRLGKSFSRGWKVFSLVREVARLIREGPEYASREARLLGSSDDACVEWALERARNYVSGRESHAVESLGLLLPLLRDARFKSQGKMYEQCCEYMAAAEVCIETRSLAGALAVLESTRFTGQIEAEDRVAVKRRTDLVRDVAREVCNVDWNEQERLERELLPLKRAIYSAAREIDLSYAAHKQRLGALDFHDLQKRLADLLGGNDRVRREYADRFRHILLDEAQDTDELQYGIIEALHADGDTLFMVGDPKQAIYEFRGADPDVFDRAVRRMPAGQRLELPENFRSRPEIISFVNGIGPELLGKSFIHMEACADYGGEWLTVPAVTALYAVQELPAEEGAPPVIEPLGVARAREAAALAEELVRLLRDRTLVRDPHARELEWMELRPKHIAVLFRTRTPIPHFERELALRGVPYVTAAGLGFYERGEILDCMMLLRVLAQPLDDLAMAAVLRSPFAGMTDSWLWRLRGSGESGERTPIYHALRNDEGVRRFVKRFEKLRKRTRSVSAADALDDAIRTFGYEAALAAHDDGPAMLANVAKLRRRLRDLGAISVAEAYTELQRARELMASEPTAPLVGPTDDVVVLTTIHQAKGLEWPVVCLPNLQSGASDVDADFSARHGVLLCDALDAEDEPVTPLSVKLLAEELRERQEAEERRLLYVALTRARERLILSACIRNEHTMPDWKGRFSKPLAFLAAHTERTLSDAGEHDCGTYLTSVRHVIGPVATTTQFQGGARLAAEIEPRQIAAVPAEPAPLAESALPLSVKVTELLAFNRCPQVYRFSHDFEIVEHTARSVVKRAESAALSPVELGTIVHALLERADFDASDTDAELERLLGAQPVERRASLARMLRPVLAGELGTAVRGARRVEREWPFAFESAGVLVEGVMDLAIQGSDGRWTVVDYKSNDLKRPDRLEYLTNYYRPQLELYALALSQAGLGEVAECALVFLTGPRIHRWAFEPESRGVDAWARDIIQRIAARDYATSAGPKCERCGYRKRRICATGQAWSDVHGVARMAGLPVIEESEL